ncbi:hypothetical protein AAHB62_26210 [Bacillus cereus]
MADVPKLLPGDTLRVGYPKINLAIDEAYKAKIISNDATNIANNATNIANVANGTSKSATEIANSAVDKANTIQDQLNQIVIEGDSSVEAAQAREDALGVTYPVLKERVDAEQLRILNEVKRAVAQSFNIESQTSQGYDDSKILSYLEGVTKKHMSLTHLIRQGLLKLITAREQLEYHQL